MTTSDGARIAGAISLAMVFVQYVPYVYATARGRFTPHVVSYVVWGIGAGIVAAAQWSAGAGAGAWAMTATAVGCLLVAGLSARTGVGYVNRWDRACLAVALVALPLWPALRDPLASVLLITAIDLAAYAVTLRKMIIAPREDSAWFYAVSLLQYGLSIVAIERHSVVATLNPAAMAAAAVIVVAFLRRERPARS
jgi:hypothetical protein